MGTCSIPLGLSNELYQPLDKVTDWVTYVAIVVVAYRNVWPIRRLMLGLFLFRSIGQVGFLLTENELLLALFPNFLEPLFLVTVTILAWERVVRHLPDWQERGFAVLSRHRWLIGTVIVDLQAPGRVHHAHRQHRPERAVPAAPRPAPGRVGRSALGDEDELVAGGLGAPHLARSTKELAHGRVLARQHDRVERLGRGSKRTIAFAPKSVSHTMSRSST